MDKINVSTPPPAGDKAPPPSGPDLGTIAPLKPDDQPVSWQPQISPSDSDYPDEQSALSAYDALYGNAPYTPPSGSTDDTQSSYPDPTLEMAYTTAPDFTPEVYRPPTPVNDRTGPAPATAKPFVIELGSLRSAEETFLSATSQAVDGYHSLHAAVKNAIGSPSIFGQIVGSKTIPQGLTPQQGSGSPSDNIPTGNMDGDSGSSVTMDPLDSEGQQFAGAINPAMEQLLQVIASTVETMGTFGAMLNNAGQMYTDGDATSAFPAPDGTAQAPQPPKTGPGFTPIPPKAPPGGS
jgi:hypothetical protein